MNISDKRINELENIGRNMPIENPLEIYSVDEMPFTISRIIDATNPMVYISRRSLKHIIDRRGSAQIVRDLSTIISRPTKVSSNFHKRP
jgi:hypothetical protein